MYMHDGVIWRLIETLRCIGRQRDDDGQNYLVKIGCCKENLSGIMHRIKLIQLKEDKAWVYSSTEFHCINLA